MAGHILDNPMWSSLTTSHAGLAEGSGPVRRFPPDIGPMAGTVDDSPESAAALRDCVKATGPVILAAQPDYDVPPGLVAAWDRPVVQMVFDGQVPEDTDPRIQPLDDDDAPEMLALALLTQPGPFAGRTHVLGQFWGVKQDGQLVAMAGERLRQPGYAEISAICTHPDHRGKGLGKTLCLKVCKAILDRDETPYLHAFQDNETAIRLYEKLGFRQRSSFVAVGLDAG